jgi:hypothetical protein
VISKKAIRIRIYTVDFVSEVKQQEAGAPAVNSCGEKQGWQEDRYGEQVQGALTAMHPSDTSLVCSVSMGLCENQ